MSEKLRIREMPSARTDVSHEISPARDVVALSQMSTATGVKHLEPKQMCCRPNGGGGSLALPVHGWIFVQWGVADVHVLCQDIMVCDSASQFQVTVCDWTLWIGKGQEILGHAIGKALVPQNRVWFLLGVHHKVHSSHAHTQCITSANSVRFRIGDEFCSARRALREGFS